MLISLILDLISTGSAILPPHLGRANYAATLDLLRQVDPDLSAQIHDSLGLKPFTCSSLLGAQSQRHATTLAAGQHCSVRVTGLTPAVSQALRTGLINDRPSFWELDHHRFQISDVIADSKRHPWAGQSSYETLAAARLAAAEPDRQVTLEFAAPVSFKSSKMNMPVPLPGLVFGSLAERWNAFTAIPLAGEARQVAEQTVAISRYRLESQPVEQKNQALRMGSVGVVTYRALGEDLYWLNVLQMLADFALYSGAGVQSATGMGQVRRLD
jgi:CRISPR-associated endoribonuclease Cas6